MSDSSVKNRIKEAAPDTVPSYFEDTPPGKITKAKDYVGLVVAALPLLGAVGTAAVWAMSYFYVGSVDLDFKQPYRSINIDVFNAKGQQTSFHTPRFELMPGHYFLQVAVDGRAPINCPADVVYGKNIKIQVDEPTPVVTSVATGSETEATDGDSAPPKKRKWWQFWRK